MTSASGCARAHGVMKMWCSKSGAMMYLTVPWGEARESSEVFDETSSVSATGEKIAMLPVLSLIAVARPPTLISPKRRKGEEKVTSWLGIMSRMEM